MASEQELKTRLGSLMTRTGNAAKLIHPTGLCGLTHGQELVVGMAAWCEHLYASIFDLVGQNKYGSTQVLGRPLLETAMLLEYLRLNAPTTEALDGLALRWRYKAVREELGLEAATRSHGPTWDRWPHDPNAELESIREEAARRGVQLTPLPEGRGLATAIGQPLTYLFVKLHSMHVHTGRLSLGSVLASRGPHTEVGATPPMRMFIASAHSTMESIRLGLAAVPPLIDYPEGRRRYLDVMGSLTTEWDELADEVGMPRPE